MRNTFTLRGAIALLALAGSAPLAVAQSSPNPRPAPQWVLNALHLSQATIQDLRIAADRQAFRFQVELGGQLRTVELEPNDIRSPGFELLVDDGVQLRRLPTPAPVTWIGHVVGLPESRAAATIVDRGLDGVVSLDPQDHEVWGIEPMATLDPNRPITEHVVYTTHDSNTVGVRCGTDDARWQMIGNPGQDVGMRLAEIAIDCDLEYYQRNSSNTTTTQNAVTRIVNNVDAIYRRDVEIQYSLTTVVIRTTSAANYVNTDMGNLLNEFANRWNVQHGAVQRDVAHLFTGKGSFSGVVGITWLGTVCSISSAYGVDKAFSSTGNNAGLVSHELGHDWNAPHCDGTSPCNIMCAGLGGCSRNIATFAPVSINTIVAFKNTRNCLTTPVVRPAITGMAPSSVAVFPQQGVTLTGTGFSGVTAVNVGALQVTPSGVTDTQLRFTVPRPASFGTFLVSVINSAGSSNSVGLTIHQVTPGFFNVPGVAISGGTIDYAMAGDPNDNWWILASFNSSATLPFLGYDVLQNGIVLTQGRYDQIGISEIGYATPANVSLRGLQMHSQVIAIDDVAPALNWISTALPTNFVF